MHGGIPFWLVLLLEVIHHLPVILVVLSASVTLLCVFRLIAGATYKDNNDG